MVVLRFLSNHRKRPEFGPPRCLTYIVCHLVSVKTTWICKYGTGSLVQILIVLLNFLSAHLQSYFGGQFCIGLINFSLNRDGQRACLSRLAVWVRIQKSLKNH
jgi:hypothetical protein